MSIVITNYSLYKIKVFDTSAGTGLFLNKDSVVVSANTNVLVFSYPDTTTTYNYNFSDITTPRVATLAELLDVIQGYIDELTFSSNVSGRVSSDNSTTSVLNNGGVFTGQWEDVSLFPCLTVACKTDQTGTMLLEFSPDGSNADSILTFNVAASTNEVHRLTVTRKYFRVVFTNDSGSNQSYLRLQTIYGTQPTLTSALNGTIQLDADSVVVRPVIPELQMAAGLFQGYSTVNKFGKNADIDIGTEDIWGGGGTWVAPTTARVHNIVSSDAVDDIAGTGARTVQIQGLNSSYVETSETVTMDGVTPVATVNSYVIIFRMVVLTAGSGGTNAGTITATAVTDATITCTIQIGKAQSQMAIYQVPAGKTAYLGTYYGGISATGNLDLELFVKPFGGVFNLKSTLTLCSTGTTQASHCFCVPLVVEEKSIIKLTGTATANNTSATGGFDFILFDND